MAKQYKNAQAVFRTPVPDIFVDEITGIDLINDTIRLDLATIIRSEPIPPSKPAVAVIGRLILPPATAQKLCLALYDYLKKQGLDPKSAVGGTGEASEIN